MHDVDRIIIRDFPSLKFSKSFRTRVMEEFFNANDANNANENILLELFRPLNSDSKRLLMAIIKNFCD